MNKEKIRIIKNEEYSINIGLTAPVRAILVNLLNVLLADTYVMMQKAWGFHWNMKGISFHANHKFFEEIYEALQDDVDAIAERVRAMNGIANSSLKQMVEQSRIHEHDLTKSFPTIREMLKIMADDYDTSIRELRLTVKKIDEMKESCDGDLNYLQDLIMRREKMAWFIRSHIEL